MLGRRWLDLTPGLLAALLLSAGSAAAAPRAGARFLGSAQPPATTAFRPPATPPGALGAPSGATLPAPGADDQDPAVSYTGTWTMRTSEYAIEGTVHESRTVGNTVVIPVQAPRVTVYYLPVRGGGILDVFLDAVDLANRVGTINQSRADYPKAWALEIGGLPATEPHTLILRHRYGRRVNFDAVAWRGAPLETPAFGASDFDPSGVTESTIWLASTTQYLAYQGLWTVWPNTTSNSWKRRDTATFTFTGDAFILYMWMSKRDYSLGRMKVFIDGAPAFKYAVINQRAGKKGWWMYYWVSLPGGPQHTIQVKHARGRRVNLEGFGGFDLSLP